MKDFYNWEGDIDFNPPAVVEIKHFKRNRKARFRDAEEVDEEDEPDHIKNEHVYVVLDLNEFQLG